MSKVATSTRFTWLALSGMAFAILLSRPLWAGAPLPDIPIPKANGGKCVEDTEYMRKNHMKLLYHQRNETVHLGIRTKKHSLKECINCHVVKVDGKPVSIASPKHFCRECHDYASVNIDCFECHASKPRAKKVAMPSAMLQPHDAMHQDPAAQTMNNDVNNNNGSNANDGDKNQGGAL